MSTPKRTVLITGCSDGGLGAGLAIAFHNAGLHVYATARNPSKMAGLTSFGIETLTLDVLSDSSIAACVATLSSKKTPLDILVNNAGAGYSMPVADMSLTSAKALFDLNAFLPLLQKSNVMIVNQTSLVSVTPVPFQSAYNASKAAMGMFSANMRLELAPFNIRVVELKTALVKSNLIKNLSQDDDDGRLPEGSIYMPVKKEVEAMTRADKFDGDGTDTQVWADSVVRDLLRKSPPSVVWRGKQATMGWFGTFLATGWTDALMMKMTGLDVMAQKLRKV